MPSTRITQLAGGFSHAGKFLTNLLKERNDNGRLLFEGQLPWVQWFFSRRPFFVWFVSTLIGLAVFVVLPLLDGLSSLPEWRANGTYAPNGVLFEPGWSVMFTVLLPLILTISSIAGQGIVRCLGLLDGVIFIQAKLSGVSLQQYVRNRLKVSGTTVSALLVIASCATTASDYFDTKDFHSRQYMQKVLAYERTIKNVKEWVKDPQDRTFPAGVGGSTPVPNWTIYWTYAVQDPLRPWQFLNVGLAYLCEFFGFLFGASFVYSFYQLLSLLAGLLRNPKSKAAASEEAFYFNPQFYDPRNRLGLACLGPLFDRYFYAVLLLQTNILLLRLDRIARANGQSMPWYPDQITQMTSQILHDPTGAFSKLFNLSSLALHDVRNDEMVFLIIVPLACLGCLVFPMLHIRRYLTEAREEEWFAKAQEHETASELGEIAKTAALRRKLDAITANEAWPNGTRKAKILLFFVVSLGLGSWLPPLLALALGVGVATTVYAWLVSLLPFKNAPKASSADSILEK